MNLEEINDRFKSGNSIPVERAYIKAEEWRVIYNCLKHHSIGKTSCPRGHKYTPDNTRINSNGSRACRACERARDRIEYGWPEELAYSAPKGFVLKELRPDSASVSNDGS